MAKHALLSPSSSGKWLKCPGSKRMELLEPGDDINAYAAEGTAAHFLASETVVSTGEFTIPKSWKQGLTITVVDGVAYWSKKAPIGRVDGYYFIDEDAEMCGYVQQYLNGLKDYAATGVVSVEQELSLESLTGEAGATGTTDAIAILDRELQIHDLKYGYKQVTAKENTQLLMYAAAAYEMYGAFYDLAVVTMVIHQPRLGAVSEWSISVSVLKDYVDTWIRPLAKRATEALGIEAGPNFGDSISKYLNPGDHCASGYCKARAFCPALKDRVVEVCKVDAGSMSLDQLSENAKLVGMVEGWADAVQARVAVEILEKGNTVEGFKAVLGKKGSRKWSDEAAVEELLSSYEVPKDIIYKTSLNTPTVVEKAAKKKQLTKQQWGELCGLITQEEAKPTVVPDDDPRAALSPKSVLDDFDNLS